MKKNIMTETEKSRRRFIKSAGKVAAYVPPAMLIAATPSYKAFAESANGYEEAHKKFHDLWGGH